MALRELFPHAIYLLGGKKYESISFQFVGGLYYAKVKRLPDSFMNKTETLRHSDPSIVKVLETKLVKGMEVLYCDLTTTDVIDGYILKEMFTDGRFHARLGNHFRLRWVILEEVVFLGCFTIDLMMLFPGRFRF